MAACDCLQLFKMKCRDRPHLPRLQLSPHQFLHPGILASGAATSPRFVNKKRVISTHAHWHYVRTVNAPIQTTRMTKAGRERPFRPLEMSCRDKSGTGVESGRKRTGVKQSGLSCQNRDGWKLYASVSLTPCFSLFRCFSCNCVLLTDSKSMQSSLSLILRFSR